MKIAVFPTGLSTYSTRAARARGPAGRSRGGCWWEPVADSLPADGPLRLRQLACPCAGDRGKGGGAPEHVLSVSH